ncbi:D-alanine--D-alanine ligase family protein [Roseateles sp. BYS96W]|uniref:D-alanine--D-alanine ligase n=1 Tax=Pelomonas nitida TaxID=3299027 RepID=A0ABW7GCZ6_9BURK
MIEENTIPVIVFGGICSERLVSVATAQNLCRHLEEAELWFWTPEGPVVEASASDLLAHDRPFEQPFSPNNAMLVAATIESAIAIAQYRSKSLILGLHGGAGENGELAALCESAGVPFTGSGSAASRTAFNKISTKGIAAEIGVPCLETIHVPQGALQLWQLESALQRHRRLVAKPVSDGSSEGLMFIDTAEDAMAIGHLSRACDYLIEPFAEGIEATVGVIQTANGHAPLEPIEIHSQTGKKFDYQSKYLDPKTVELCPSTFSAKTIAELKHAALRVHLAIGLEGYSRSDFIVTESGPVFLEINTLPGLTAASLLPKELAYAGIGMKEFLVSQLQLARIRAGK